ncbi:MAG: hypothetical protein AB1489_35120 [Acidobacteriota bacterium]
MFSLKEFVKLYTLLDGDMVEVDCGLRCQQYCCRAADAVKYLLPGEAECFTDTPPPNFELVEHFIYLGYRGRDGCSCACTRAQRPFCCRIFPFRPVIDLTKHQVVDLQKVSGAGFDLHCWVSEPTKQWRQSAIEAWQFIFSDLDNLNFYARYALFLAQARAHPYISSYSLLSQVNETLSGLSERELWQVSATLFKMLGYPPSDWPTLEF